VQVVVEKTLSAQGFHFRKHFHGVSRAAIQEKMENEKGLRFRVRLPEEEGLFLLDGPSSQARCRLPPPVEGFPCLRVAKDLIGLDQLPAPTLGPLPPLGILVRMRLEDQSLEGGPNLFGCRSR